MLTFRVAVGVLMVVWNVEAIFTRFECDYSHLNVNEQKAFAELLELVKQDWGRDDEGMECRLAHWLAKTDYNVEAARQKIRQSMEWRDQHKLDTILDEDWNDMYDKFPVSFEFQDKEDRPMVYIDLNDWDICGFAGEGSHSADRFSRYMYMIQEEAVRRIKLIRDQGKKIRNYRFLTNAAGFTQQKHGCEFLKNLLKKLSSRPDMIPVPSESKSIYVNVPHAYKSVFAALPLISKTAMLVYGQDQAKWESALLEIIDRDQLPPSLFNPPAVKDNSDGILHWNDEL